MRKIQKLFIAFFCMLACFTVATACRKAPSQSNEDSSRMEQEIKANLTLEQTNMSLVLGERKPLYANYNVIDGATLRFSSSNTEVVTIDEKGWVEAKKAGSATLQVEYAEEIASCQVTVGLGGLLPQLQFEQIVGDVAFVNMSDELSFEGKVVFNDRTYTDCTWTYQVKDETIGEIENGLFIPKKAGETEVIVSASWRDVESASLQKTVRVTVSNLIELYVNGGTQSEIVLYTRGEFAGETYATSAAFIPKAYENGEERATQASLISGEEIISFENDTVTALKRGVAIVRISCTDSANTVCEKDIVIRVERPIYRFETAIDFSALDGDLPLDTLFFGEEVTLTEAYQETQNLFIENNLLKGVFYGESKPISTLVSLYTDEVGVEVNLNVYAKILRTSEDIRCLDISEMLIAANKGVLRGYYIMANDIDATGLTPNTHSGLDSKDSDGAWYFNKNVAGFSGIFDGNGHTLDINVDSLGVFGLLLNGAQVKNVGLNTYVTANTGKGMSTNLILSNILNRVTISNSYISITDKRIENNAKIRYNPSLTNSVSNTMQFNNVVVELKTDTWNSALTGSVLGLGDSVSTSLGSYVKRFVNVYFIMPDEETPIIKTSKYRIYGGNDTIESDEYIIYKYSNVKRYSSYLKMAADTENSYAGFSGNHWEKSASAPIWKSEFEKHFYTTVDDEETDNLHLYTQATIEGEDETFKTSAKIGMKVLSTPVNVEYTVLTGNDVVSIENGVLTATTYGRARILLTFEQNGVIVERMLDVFVTIPARHYKKTVEYFSAMDGELPLTDIFGEEVQLVSAFDENDTELTVQDNKVLGLKTIDTGVTETTISIYTNEAGWIVPVRAYTKVIDSVSDMQALEFTEERIASGEKTIKGYYIVTADIGSEETPYAGNTHTGLLQKNASGDWLYNVTSYGFAGVLDGNGYSIYQKATRLGLFGGLANGATVKNLAIHTYAKDGELQSGLALVLAEDLRKTTIENCYFSLTDKRTTKGYNLILSNGSGTPVLKNIVVEYVGYVPTKDGGVLFNNEIMRTDESSADGVITATQSRYTNVYVIAPTGTPIGKITSTKTNYVYASNETDKRVSNDTTAVWSYANQSDGTITVARFNMYNEMPKTNDYTLFGDVWDMTGGVPVWKNLKTRYYQATADGEAVNRVQLETNTQFGGKTSVTLGVGWLGTAIKNATYQLIEGDEIVSLNGATLTALQPGNATLRISFTADGKDLSLDLPVSVVVPVADYEETIEYFSALDGVYIADDGTTAGKETKLNALFGETVNITKATYRNGEEITVEDNKLTGLATSAVTYTAMQEVEITLYSDTMGYNVTLQVYTKVLNDADDLAVFDWQAGVTKWGGYYFVRNDITADSTKINAHAGLNNASGYGFAGVVEGNKKTISFYHGGNGLFGRLTGGAIIQNIRLDAYANGGVGESAALGMDGGNAYSDRYTLQNMYVTITDVRTSATANSTLIKYRRTYGYFTNIVIERKTAYDINKASGALFSDEKLEGSDFSAQQGKLQNVFVIDASAKVRLAIRSSAKADYYATNETDQTAVESQTTAYVYTNAYRYTSFGGITAPENATWQIVNNQFAWKN